MPINSFENYPMNWKPVLANIDMPIYKLLAMQLEQDIKNGGLRPGTMLPPQRELADYLDLNLSTISRAFKICEQKGLIYGTTGKGTFVSSSSNSDGILLSSSARKLIEMGAIIPESEPNQIIIETMQQVLQDPSSLQFFQYERIDHNVSQKKSAAAWLQLGNFSVDPAHILFAAGGQNAITGILASLFQCGDKLGTNSVTYTGLKTAANMLGIQLTPLPEKDGELDYEQLQRFSQQENLKGLYLIPDYHNPTTHTMSLETRKDLANIIHSMDLIVIEDGINTLLRDDPIPPIASFAQDKTIYISSVSKTLSPGLRMAFIACPPSLYQPLSIGLYNTNIMVSPLLAEVTSHLIQSGKASQLVQMRRNHTKKRNQYINTILSDHQILGDDYCNFRWLFLPASFTGKSFELCAQNAGVQVYSAERFSIGSSPAPNAIRLAITAEQNEQNFKKGILILKDILSSQTGFTYF